ncbi:MULTISPECIES: 4-(cytidine 5'-diphospho)-2-C-methyl-D-erythritol kinase [unclassified Neisseria]|uniref:4-(cytidine 5'-diphospho)-2-C-methyl-D-erythritol kinase n=1 Tax=unclassified Neisseria TaxID=2623750 RepID=UPI00107265C2|nr:MULTISPECIES: 4-(cytidine 5'-diphospho)-2-C-methyl-D-erythritol kinase [unclassified Neisseria]MBF0802866.1 4-(cytidine 5'-diphospho)-2-C-methyl-D-erythritol kinase [Neisseria sp. 19428wB4_WF04]TFU44646.1 4-(cytidine 5'-diphospho)-2-C-methyl-D-erythritol kinase [Neisseria sp. WF04]
MVLPVSAAAQAYPAPAKLNLDLRITGRRADGYHELESIFCLIDLCDTVYIALRDDGQILLHTPIKGVPPETDLTYRAAAALQPFSDGRNGADIWLEKRIPMGGGLGGGSSDAATVLMVLNKLWRCALTQQQLMDTGLQLGADVPFFIFGKNAFAKGIGEQLTELDIPQQWYVVVKPPVHISTAVIFSHERLTRNSEPSIIPSFQSLQPFRNDMQAVVFQEYSEVSAAYSALEKFGKTLMTGSGACLFAAFNSQEEAVSVFEQISKIYEAYCIRGLALHPLQI